MYIEAKRRCDTGCRREASHLVEAWDLAFCGKHEHLFEACLAALEEYLNALKAGLEAPAMEHQP